MVAVIEWEEKWHPGEVAKAKHSQTKENPSAWGAWVWGGNWAQSLMPGTKARTVLGGRANNYTVLLEIKMSSPD